MEEQKSWELIDQAYDGNVQGVRELIDAGADVNVARPHSRTPLQAACSNGHVSVAQLLINRGANVNKAHGDATPLGLASEYGHSSVVMLLLERGAALNEVDECGSTPLQYACRWGSYNLSFALWLIEIGADVNLADCDGWTPLHRACHNNDLDLAEMFIEAGAKINTANNDGLTPFHIACQRGCPPVIKLIFEKERERGRPISLPFIWPH